MSDYAVLLAARMGSSRLPGKPMVDYGAGPNLGQIIRRWKSSERNPTVIVATTIRPDDGPIVALCQQLGVPCWLGAVDNVVARMNTALLRYAPGARYVARALADNPLVDVDLADWRLDVLEESGADGLWYGGAHERITYAGTTDVWSRAAWDRIAAESSGCQLEHAGVHYWENIGSYHAIHLPLPRREYLAPVRTELDTPADLEMLRAVWRVWNQPPMLLPTRWALGYLAKHPEVVALNAEVPRATQSEPMFNHNWRPWVCPNCQQRMASRMQGSNNLKFFCPGCGMMHTYYSRPVSRRKEAHIDTPR